MASGKSEIKVGDKVTHPKLGQGDVLDVYPFGEDTCAVISFEKWGQKRIILKYAGLKVMARPEPEAEAEAEAEEEES
jgi:hypothetical protein